MCSSIPKPKLPVALRKTRQQPCQCIEPVASQTGDGTPPINFPRPSSPKPPPCGGMNVTGRGVTQRAVPCRGAGRQAGAAGWARGGGGGWPGPAPEVPLDELVLLHLEPTLEDLERLLSPHGHVHSDLLVTADREGAHRVARYTHARQRGQRQQQPQE
jgi:hypothetical protein